MKNFSFCTFLAFLAGMAPWSALAAPNVLTYQGRILKSDGSALEYNNVSFQFEVTSPDGLCVIYREQVDGINMTNSGGVFDVAIGSGTKSFPAGPTFKLLDSFANAGAVSCFGGASYTPSFDDVRKLRVQFHDGSGWKVISPDSEIRSVPFAGHAMSASKLGSYTSSEFVLKTGIPTCASGTFLSWNGSALTCENVAGASGGTVTNVTSTNPYLTVVNGTSNPALTLNVGTTTNTVAAGDDSRLSDSRVPTGSAGGDLSSTYPNPKVSKIQGVAVSATAPASGEFFKYNGAQWLSSGITTSDVAGLTASLSSYLTQSYFNSAVASANCSVSQTMYWNSATGNFLCQSINVGLAGDVSGSSGAVSVDKIKGVGVDFSTAPTNGQILRFNGTSWVPGADNNAGGTITALTGDVTASGTGSVAATVAFVAGSSAANVHSAELAANAATDLNTVSTIVKRDASGNFAAGRASLSSLVLRDSGSNTATLVAPTTVATSYTLKLPTAQGGSNQMMINDGAGNLSWTSLSAMGVTSVGVTSPITNTGSASAPVIAIQQANGSQAGYLSSADWTIFNGKQSTALNSGQIWVGNGSNVAAAVTAAGDVTISNAGATLVGKIQGTGVVSTTPTATNNIFKYNGTNWAPGFIGVADIRSTAAGNGQFFPTTCTAAQTLNWQSATDNYVCTNIAIGDSQITYASKTAKTFLAAPTAGGVPTFRTIASTDLPTTGVDGAYINGGNSFGAAATIGLNDNYKLSLKTNNATRMTIDSAGKVAIGANVPSAQLHVVGTASVQTDYAIAAFEDSSANGLGVGVDTTNGWAWLYGRSAGVSPRPVAIFAHNSNQTPDLLVSGAGTGINIASPQAPLHVATSGNGIFIQQGANDNRGGEFNGFKSRGTVAAPAAVQLGDRLAALYGDGYTGSGWSSNAGAIQILAAENFTNSNRGTSLDFGTTPLGSTVRASRMTIDAAGNVGIGTTNPGATLDVVGNAAWENNSNTANGAYWSFWKSRNYGAVQTNDVLGFFNFYGSDGAGQQRSAYINSNVDGAVATGSVPGNLIFATTKAGNADSTERMRITSAGNVGIGTTAPATALHISGSAAYTTITNSNTAAGGADWKWYSSSTGSPLGANAMCFGVGTCIFEIFTTGNATLTGTLTQSSDVRLKRDISSISGSLDSVMKLEGVSYYWKDSKKESSKQIGLIAQEVEKVFPEAVRTDASGFKSVAYQNLVAPIINAIHELKAMLDGMQNDVAALKEEMNLKNQEINKLKIENDKKTKELNEIKQLLCLQHPEANLCH